MHRLCAVALGLACLVATPTRAATDGVYHPIVNAFEREVEYGLTLRGLGEGALSLQRFSVAYAWNERFATELYVYSEQLGHGGRRTRGAELEALWQLSEQGEYWADWGLLVELESGRGTDQREASVMLLVEKELGNRWVGTANFGVEYEYGERVVNEFETAFRGQLRYLWRPEFEPALELYLDDQDYAIGPAVLGAIRISPGKQLHWELGLPLGINSATPSTSARLRVEFEF